MSFKENFITHVLIAYVYLASGLIVNILQVSCLPLWYLGYGDLYRKYICRLNYLTWCLIPGIAQWWSGMDVYVYSLPDDRKMLGKESAIATMNHRGGLDWVVSWVYSDYCNILGNAKCMVKSALRYVPALGWSWWMAEYIFLKRKIDKDRDTLSKAFHALSTFKEHFWLLIFPEGTRYTEERHRQGVEFAKKRGVEPFKHLLYPKTKGFVLSVQGLRGTASHLYDATVLFRGKKETSLRDMICGKPCQWDFFVRRIPLEQIPQNEEECSEYLFNLHREKDELCAYHNEHDEFPVGDEHPSYKGIVRNKIPKNKLSLAILITWCVLTLVPLFHFIATTVVYGTWISKALLTLAALAVAAIFQIMLNAGKAKDT